MRWPWDRVRGEVAQALAGIAKRLEDLETAEPPQPDATLQEDHDRLWAKVEAVREALAGQLAHEVAVLSAGQQGLHDALQEVSDRYKNLMVAVADGIERVDRSERRIHAVVARARKKLADVGVADEGLDTEATELEQGNGEGSQPAQLQLMPGPVEGDDGAPSSVRGVTIGELRRALRGGN